VLETHANLLPIALNIDKHCHRAALRLISLPPNHPLTPLVRRCAKHKPRRHISALHVLLHTYGLTPSCVETILPTAHHLALTTRIRTHIAASREAAIAAEQAVDEGTKMFTDGSGSNGHVGAAATMIHQGSTPKTLRYQLGALTSHTVYEGELVGLLLAAELIRRHPSAPDPYHIFLDNQAAITAPTQGWR
jgi:hypothetical protein